MGDSIMPATREPIADGDVDRILAAAITQHHEGLAGAKIAKLWMLDRPVTSWGGVKISNEVLWHLSDGFDIVLVLNKTLWAELSDSARLGLVDHFLSLVAVKTGGQTEMKTNRGTRQLYESERPSLSVHAHVMARNPTFVAEVKELARLHRALTNPRQFLLDFREGKEQEPAPAAATSDPAGEEEEQEQPEPVAAAAGG